MKFRYQGRMIPRAYLFDYGGTLDGEGWHWFDRTLHLYRAAGCTEADGTLKRAFYTADHAIAEEAAREGYRLRPLLERHVELQMGVLGDKCRRFGKPVIDGFCDMTDTGWRRARRALGALRGRVKLGVVSNFYGNLDAMLDESGLAPLLDVVVESVKAGAEKPDAKIYRIAAARLALDPRDVVMVGDNFARDVAAARAAGMRAIWLRRGEQSAPTAGVAEQVISCLDEVPGVAAEVLG